MRQVVLDTETTGLEVSDGHRVIEIGAVEIINRRITDRYYHQYLNPEREIDAGAQDVHGITSEFLQDKPTFVDISDDFLEFVKDSELIIHNAPFDVGFLNAELSKTSGQDLNKACSVFDTLVQARKLYPGQRNSLDALCKRYEIDNSHRELHGALLDAQILAEVYLVMTGGQVSLGLKSNSTTKASNQNLRNAKQQQYDVKIVNANDDELAEHEKLMAKISQSSDASSIWINPQTKSR